MILILTNRLLSKNNENFTLIEETIVEHIVNSTHIIRNNIVLLMGFTTGTEIGHQIALIEINLLNLKDFVDEEINWWKGWCLKHSIRSATYKLESALFKISLGIDIGCSLTQAQSRLDKARGEVDRLLSKGKISQELADIIHQKLIQAHDDIEGIINSI